MKMEDTTETTSKVDMSLDDIIKMNRKQSQAKKRNNTFGGFRKRQQFLAIRKNLRAGIRSQNLRKRRFALDQIQQPNTSRSVSARFGASRREPKQANRSVALSVLRRARQTAVAAARAAADVAELIQRNRTMRPRMFVGRRNITPTSSIAQDRHPNNRRAWSTRSRITDQVAFTSFNQLRRTNRSANYQRRPRRRPKQINRTVFASQIQPRATDFQNGLSLPSRSLSQNQRWRARRNNRNYANVRTRGGYPLPARRSSQFSSTRDAEYLAQARALIQAQNEQSQYSLPINARQRWQPNNPVRTQKKFNFYAQYWNNQ